MTTEGRVSDFAVFACLLAAGCASHRTDEVMRLAPSAASLAAASSSATSTIEPRYDVHEWGLIREDQNANLRVGSVAPPREHEVIVITKPVLYFHADALLTLRSVSVHVPGGEIAETWPLARVDAGEKTQRWLDVAVDPTSACRSSRLPRKNEPPCSKLAAEDPCESVGLAEVRTVDASCVRVGDATETFLFYRGSTATVTPPLRFKSQSNGHVVVENEGDRPIPGFLIRIETAGRETRTLSVRPPAPHSSVDIGRTFPLDKSVSPVARVDEAGSFEGEAPPQTVTGPAREDIRATMRDVGQLDTEVDAFMKAWDEALFGIVVRGGVPVIDPQTTFLYFLPEASIQRYAEVSFDPPPRTFRRALAVWTRLAASGWGR